MERNVGAWFEITVEEMARARRFYETVLGVTMEAMPAPEGMPMEMVTFPGDPDRPGVSGALVRVEGAKAGGGGTLIYFVSEDCAVEAGRVEAAGGRLEQGKTPIGEFGFFAVGVDTEGNRFGIHSMH